MTDTYTPTAEEIAEDDRDHQRRCIAAVHDYKAGRCKMKVDRDLIGGVLGINAAIMLGDTEVTYVDPDTRELMATWPAFYRIVKTARGYDVEFAQ